MTRAKYPHPPGHPEAKKDGCTCPRMDNNNGEGAYQMADGEPVYWFRFDCPFHGNTDEELKPDDMVYPIK